MSGKETFIAVIYTDGKKFLNLRRTGRKANIGSIPQAKKDYSSDETDEMQAVSAFFQSTGLRVKPQEVTSLGIFESGENFDVQAFYIRDPKLIALSEMKSVRKIHLGGEFEGETLPAIADFNYTPLELYSGYDYSLEGVRKALETFADIAQE